MDARRSPLRLLLAFIAVLHVAAALLFLAPPRWLLEWYGVSIVDPVVRGLAAACGALLLVFAVAASLAALRPAAQRGLIAILMLEQLALFIVDVALIARGDFRLTTLLPEMLLFLVVVAGLVRWYPGRLQEIVAPEPEQEPGERREDEETSKDQ